jgi:hypothetical protein
MSKTIKTKLQPVKPTVIQPPDNAERFWITLPVKEASAYPYLSKHELSPGTRYQVITVVGNGGVVSLEFVRVQA